MAWVRTPRARGEGTVVTQPIPFSHALHAGTFKVDCRFCHSEVEWSAHAGMPPTDRCVTCHTPAWQATALLAPVRASLATGAPIPWRRVTQLPQFVYFNHAMHVRHDVACSSCHGDVAAMPVVRQVSPLTMGWCVNCHRQADTTIAHRYTNCTTCHR
jgi:hypothetical protein